MELYYFQGGNAKPRYRIGYVANVGHAQDSSDGNRSQMKGRPGYSDYFFNRVYCPRSEIPTNPMGFNG